ncbi:hypothetical protein DFP72DRAFT_1125266 [Ephemerocybe angulata]|uniref:C2H2-type domain-containing protein n=1 Tax=Ephemerocybe angulata TaxID=980116 RepID=A0A8H6HXZ4_9AGAR|nr:hypothetical protein DFP72DRAFT_1125266 [Tulosesus angulatus]
MRLSLIALIPLTAFFSVVHARSDHTHEAREHISELATRACEDSLLSTRQDLADLSTRDLVNELEDRLQRRRDDYICLACNVLYSSKKVANQHARILKHFKRWTKNGAEVAYPLK